MTTEYINYIEYATKVATINYYDVNDLSNPSTRIMFKDIRTYIIIKLYTFRFAQNSNLQDI